MLSLTSYLTEKNLLTPELETEINNYYNLTKKNRSPDSFSWGKYKGRSIAEVFNFDKSYCEWALKQQYTAKAHKDLINELILNKA